MSLLTETEMRNVLGQRWNSHVGEEKHIGLLLLLFLENVIVKRKCAAERVDAKKALKGYIIIWRMTCYLFTKVKDLQAVA